MNEYIYSFFFTKDLNNMRDISCMLYSLISFCVGCWLSFKSMAITFSDSGQSDFKWDFHVCLGLYPAHAGL